MDSMNPDINDGRGFYDNVGLCDTIIKDLNNLVRSLVTGQYLQFSGGISSIAQRVVNLKKGIQSDIDDKNAIIEELKEENARLVEQITGLPVDRERNGGGGNG